MPLVNIMKYPSVTADSINNFFTNVGGTEDVIGVLMDLWMYAQTNPKFIEDIEKDEQLSMHFTLKHTLQFVAEMQHSTKSEWVKSPNK